MDTLQLAKVGSGSIFIASIIGLVIFVILVIYNYTVKPILPFLPSSQIQYEALPTYQTQTLYGSARAPNDTALDFTSITNFNPNEYTLSFDVFINGTYKSTDVPRVLLYFSTAPVPITSNSFKEFKLDSVDIPRILNSSQTDILTVFNNTNFIVYMDPVKNDLKVGIITTDSTNVYLELLPTINNVPINQTFQITMIRTNKFVEVYKNKLLVTTYKMKYNAYVISTSAKLYSPIGFIGDTIKIANIQYFNNVLTSSQVRSQTNALKDKNFFSAT